MFSSFLTNAAGQGDGSLMGDNSSDSDSDKRDDQRRITLRIDDWLNFKVDTEVSDNSELSHSVIK